MAKTNGKITDINGVSCKIKYKDILLTTIMDRHADVYLSEVLSNKPYCVKTNYRDSRAILEGFYISETIFTDVCFDRAILNHISFHNCKFIDCSFGTVYMDHTTFDKCEFKNCDFIGETKIAHCEFSAPSFSKCTFSHCEIVSTRFFNPSFYQIEKDDRFNQFDHCEMVGTSFIRAFEECNVTFYSNGFYCCFFNSSVMKNMVTNALFNTDIDSANDFFGCRLENAITEGFVLPMACPEEGGFIAFKKVRWCSKETNKFVPKNNYAIAVLEIPAEAKRSSANGRKCRCDLAKVIRFETLDGKEIKRPGCYEFKSTFEPRFEYKKDAIINPMGGVRKFNKNRYQECASGIHFFITRREAVNYNG